MTEKQFAAGGVVIRKKGDAFKVLLIKDSYGHWTWPKGHLEKGETLRAAALREVEEETGIKEVEILEELGKQEYSFMLAGAEIFKAVHIFLMEDKSEDELVPQMEEVALAEWFSPEDAIEKIEYEGSRELLEKGIAVYKEKAKKEK